MYHLLCHHDCTYYRSKSATFAVRLAINAAPTSPPIMIIIPSISLLNNQIVHLTRGDFEQQHVYRQDPAEWALELQAAGFRHLHITDLEGIRTGEPKHLALLESLSSVAGLYLQYAGGIRSTVALQQVLAAGASRVVLGSMSIRAYSRMTNWVEEFGAGRLIVSIDLDGNKIITNARTESSGLSWEFVFDYYLNLGVQQFIVTDISLDGMMAGSALHLYEKVRKEFPEAQLMASGGISTEEELSTLHEMGCYGAIIGKALHEEQLQLHRLADLQQQWTG